MATPAWPIPHQAIPKLQNAHPTIVPLSNFRLIVSGCASSSSGGLFPKMLQRPQKDVCGDAERASVVRVKALLQPFTAPALTNGLWNH